MSASKDVPCQSRHCGTCDRPSDSPESVKIGGSDRCGHDYHVAKHCPVARVSDEYRPRRVSKGKCANHATSYAGLDGIDNLCTLQGVSKFPYSPAYTPK